MSNEEKYNKVQQLFIAITGCNPEKNVFEVSERFKIEAMATYPPSLFNVSQSVKLSDTEYRLLSDLIHAFIPFIHQADSITSKFRQMKEYDEWEEDDVQD